MKRVSNVVAASLGIILYVALVLFAELQVVHIDDFASYEAAIAFTAMSFLALTFVVLLQAATGMFKIQWYLPIVVMTAVYLVMVDAIIFFRDREGIEGSIHIDAHWNDTSVLHNYCTDDFSGQKEGGLTDGKKVSTVWGSD